MAHDSGGMKLTQVKRMKEREEENGQLKRAVAELMLDKLILKEVLEENFRAPPGVGAAFTTCSGMATQ